MRNRRVALLLNLDSPGGVIGQHTLHMLLLHPLTPGCLMQVLIFMPHLNAMPSTSTLFLPPPPAHATLPLSNCTSALNPGGIHARTSMQARP